MGLLPLRGPLVGFTKSLRYGRARYGGRPFGSFCRRPAAPPAGELTSGTARRSGDADIPTQPPALIRNGRRCSSRCVAARNVEPASCFATLATQHEHAGSVGDAAVAAES